MRDLDEDFDRIERHLAELDALEAFPPNLAMLERLRAGKTEPEDLAFYEHELFEALLMAKGVPARDAHMQTLAHQDIAYEAGYEARLYHRSVLLRYPDHFNPAVHGGRSR